MAFLWPSSDLPSGSVDAVVRLLLGLGVPWRPELPAMVEVVSNVVIMVPFGVLGRLVWPGPGWRGWTLAGLGVSVTVELTQALVLVERWPSLVDVAANTLGAAIGAALVRAPARVTADRRGCRGTPQGAARPHDHDERTT